MRKFCSVLICISILLSSVIFAIPASATAPDAPTVEEQQLDVTDSYCYDRLSDYQKILYNYLKELYDTWRPEPGEHRLDVTQYVSEAYPEDREGKFLVDFLYAELALCADDPYYGLRFKLSGAHVDDYSNEIPSYILEVTCMDLATEDNIAQIDGRINQIVNAIGEGDRYTKLYKLAHFFSSNTFYDPYRNAINEQGHWLYALETRGHLYDSLIYGIMLKNIAVCGGFAASVKLLCNELDIPCIIMESDSHAWNLVQMEDGSWYRFDMVRAVGTGWDEEPNFDDYIKNTFLNNNDTMLGGFYNNPRMLSVNGIPLITEFPEHAEGRYEYKGSTTDFSYTLPESDYVAGEPKFIYRVNPSVDSEEKTCTIINYEGRQAGDLVIPAEIDGYTVTNIAPFAFYYCTGFDGKLVFPDTLTSIGRAAFAGCYNLSGVELPDSLSTISEGAFIGCKALTEITLPDSVVQIDEWAFGDCTSLETVVLGGHIQKIDDFALGFVPLIDDLFGIYPFERYQGITIYAPEGSAAQKYASDNEIDFAVQGTLCDFVDDDGEWEYFKELHFHTCSHGIKIDLAEHTHEQGYFNCGDRCDTCGAQCCSTYGFMESVEVLKDAHPATCISSAFSGNLWCVCGKSQLGFGEYIGDPIPHTPLSEEWVATESSHYQLCECGAKLNRESHTGGTATTTEKAHCEVCNAEYGELLHSHTPMPDYWERDEYTHWRLCEDWSCDVRLNEEAHYGGTATTGSLAICEVCGVAYGELFNDPDHEHSSADGVWFLDGDDHYQICVCGAMFNSVRGHSGGTATETERAKCSMCGAEYGALLHEHSLKDSEWKFNNSTHWHLCECGSLIDEAPHSGGTATETERAKCEICGARYGELVKKNITEATKTEPEIPLEYTIKGCGAALGMGSVSAIVLSLSSFICFRKKED